MESPRGKVIEYVPRGEELASKMSMLGCGIQMLFGLIVSQIFLWVLVFIALVT